MKLAKFTSLKFFSVFWGLIVMGCSFSYALGNSCNLMCGSGNAIVNDQPCMAGQKQCQGCVANTSGQGIETQFWTTGAYLATSNKPYVKNPPVYMSCVPVTVTIDFLYTAMPTPPTAKPTIVQKWIGINWTGQDGTGHSTSQLVTFSSANAKTVVAFPNINAVPGTTIDSLVSYGSALVNNAIYNGGTTLTLSFQYSSLK